MGTFRETFKDIVKLNKARVWTAWGFGLDDTKIEYAASNNFLEKARSLAGTSNKPIWRIDADDSLRIGEEAIAPMHAPVTFNLATNASLVTQHFFIAPYAMEVLGLSCVFTTADGVANTGYVTHETGAQVPGTGFQVMSGTFNLNATAATVQQATIYTEYGTVPTAANANFYNVIRMAAGDRLSFKFTSAVTSLAGLAVTLTLSPGGKGTIVPFVMQANGDIVDQSFFVANRDYIVTRIDEVHSTKGTNGSAVTADIKKCTGTQAAASGTTLLSAVLSLKTTINVVQNGSLTATAADLRLAPGDRLALDVTGTLTAVAGLVIMVSLQAVEKRIEVSFNLSKNANQAVNQVLLLARRNYEIVCVSEVHAVAAGGASKLQLTRESGTTASGSGTTLLSNNTSAGFDLNATAETVQVGTYIDTRFNFLMAGDRLSVKYSAAAQSTAGVIVTVSLIPR